MHDLVFDLIAIAVCGALGGFVNVFIGDSGLHLPVIEDGIFRPGYMGVVLVGMVASVGAWLATQASTISFTMVPTPPVTLHLSELSTAIIVGFGGARWFKSEGETTVFRRVAAVAAAKAADPIAAAAIAAGSPIQALAVARQMP